MQAQLSSSPSLSTDLSRVAEKLQESTVHVRNGRRGAGSGVIWRSDGLIVTNAHVVGNRSAHVRLQDDRELEGRIVAIDASLDLAAVRIDADYLPAAPIGDSDSLRVGQLVVAVGHPLGLTNALTCGIIHAIGSGRAGQWIQADIELLPGNSGGPLADANGRVLGINSMIAGGLGLAVPSNVVNHFLREQPVPRLGISAEPVMVAAGGGRVAGLLVVGTEVESAADLAGVSLGDVIIGVNDKSFGDHRSLGAALAGAGSTAIAELDILRGGVQQRLLISGTGGASKEAA